MQHPNPDRIAQTDNPIHPLLAERYSPYVYEPKAVEPDKLRSCFEAARWAASSFNEQPWTFFVATRDDEAAWSQMLECLMEANQAWAKDAGALVLTVAARNFTRNGKPNRVAEHDVALAVANLTFQAMHTGLQVHQMAGINQAVARQTFDIPDGHDPVTALTIGYAAHPDAGADQDIAKRDRGQRQRKPLSEIVMAGKWGTSAEL